jgi:hypothetical protein
VEKQVAVKCSLFMKMEELILNISSLIKLRSTHLIC